MTTQVTRRAPKRENGPNFHGGRGGTEVARVGRMPNASTRARTILTLLPLLIGAPAAAQAAPSAVDQALVESSAPKLVGNMFAMERTEDLKTFFASVDPKLLVHTTTEVTTDGEFCPSAWSSAAQMCDTFGPSAKRKENLAAPDWLPLPKYGWAMGWGSADGDVALTYYAFLPKKFSKLAANTHGFALRKITSAPDRIQFLSLDGSVYHVPATALATGATPVAQWPKEVQHTLYMDADESFNRAENHPAKRPWDPPPPAVVERLHKTRTALEECNQRVWDASTPAYDAIDAANILESAREARRRQLGERVGAQAYRTCRGAFAAHGASIVLVNDEKRKNRQALYEANRARFGK